MKNICIIRQGFSDDVRVRKEANALVKKGYSVDLICVRRKNEKKYETVNNVNIFRIPLKRRRGNIAKYIYEYMVFFFFAFFKLNLSYLQKRYDVVQVNTLPDFLVFSTIIPKLFGARIILDLHEPSPELFGTIFGNKKKMIISLVKFCEKISIKYADHAVTVSEQMKRNHIKKGVKPSKLSVILNVPNLEFDPSLYNVEKCNDQFVVICHGTMLKRYGQDIAIEAINILKEEIPSIRLKILGTGQYERKLKKLTKSLMLNKYVKFYGYLPYLDMIKMIKSADIGIVPIQKNPYSDLVHTNKMFEYIAMHKPVVISRTNAVEEYFGENNMCLKFFESGNARDLAKGIKELYENPDIREKMIKNAYEKYESDKWEISMEKYCSLFAVK